MDRPGRQQAKLNTLIRTVRIGQEVALTVVGAAPLVMRVLSPKPGKLFEFVCEEVDAETFTGGQLWPADLFGPAQLIYNGAWVVSALKPVDLVTIYSGATKFGTADQGFYLWQRHVADPLTRLSILEIRAAVESPWIRDWREPRHAMTRGIILR